MSAGVAIPRQPGALGTGYRIIVDVPCKDPKLGFDGYVEALSAIVRESAPQFAIGIFGSWGSGKTTLMNALRARLDEHQPNSDLITVGFSAWRYEKEPQLIVPLIDTIREAVVAWSANQPKSVAKQARKGAVMLGRVAAALLSGLSLKVGLPGAVDLSFDANAALSDAEKRDEETKAEKVPRSFYYASFKALNEAFASIGTGDSRRIVVFIDDLDRCLPTGALEVMESMKLFFDLKGFVFVVGLDRAVVEWCVETRYQRERAQGAGADGDTYTVKGSDYINKIFQVPFSLPPVSVSDLDMFMESIIADNALAPDQSDHMRNIVRPHLDYVLGDLGVNPRRLKQYMNSYVLQMSVKPALIADAVLAIQTITYRDDWKVVRNALYTDRDLLLAALLQPDMAQIKSALEDLDPEYLRIPDSFFEYIAAGVPFVTADGPGRPLVTVGANIQEYLYSGEATLSTVNTPFVTIIPIVGKLRTMLRVAIAEDGTLQSAAFQDFQKQLDLAQSYVASVPGAIGQLVMGSLQSISAEASQMVPSPNSPIPVLTEPLKAFRARTEERITSAKQNLLRAYDASRAPSLRSDLPRPEPAVPEPATVDQSSVDRRHS